MSARWPGKLPTTEEVEVKVPDSLPAVSVAVDNNAESGIRETHAGSYRSGCRKGGRGEFRGGLTNVEKGGDVHPGNDEIVVRSLGSDVLDCDDLLILVHNPGGCGPV